MVPSQILTSLALLSASVTAAKPLSQATPLVKGALVTAGNTLTANIDSALTAAAGSLDAADPTGFPGDLVADLLALSVAADDQATLADMRGTVGRAVFNLGQA